MRWLARLFGAVPREEREGIRLDTSRSYWEIDGPESFAELFNAQQGWLPEGTVLYFEGGSPDTEILDFLTQYSVGEQTHIAIGTVWPRPKIYHIPATKILLAELSRIMKNHACAELAIHFHAYRNNSILIEWHDAFSKPMLMSGLIPEEQVKAFCDRIGRSFRKIVEKSAPSDAAEPRRVYRRGR
jgi:hypothetical protein